jgi:hypothetical protein
MPSPRTKRYADRKVIETIQSYAAKGWPQGMIADALNEEGTPAPRGGAWKAATVAHVLKQNAAPIVSPKAPASMCIHVQQHMIRRGDLAAKAFRRPERVYSYDVEEYEPSGRTKGWTEIPLTEDEIHAHQERSCLEYRALEHLNWHERAARTVTFSEPHSPGFGRRAHEVSGIVEQLTRATGKDVNALLDQIRDQPEVKGPLRVAVNALLTELATLRQENLYLRQQALKASRHT